MEVSPRQGYFTNNGDQPISSPAAIEDGLNEKKPYNPDAGRRVTNPQLSRQLSTFTEDGGITRMGVFYRKFNALPVLAQYAIYVVPFGFFIAILIIIGATAGRHNNIGGVNMCWFFTWIEVVWLGFWVAKSIAYYLPSIFQSLCGFVNSGTRKYAMILTALRWPLTFVMWAAVCLATFYPIMTQNPDQRRMRDTTIKHWEHVIRNIMFAALLSFVFLTVEKLIVQIISIGYHRKQFDLRIKDSKHQIRILALLYDASRTLFPTNCPAFKHEDRLIHEGILPIRTANVNRHEGQGPSARRLVRNVNRNVGRVGDKVASMFGQVAHDITGRQVFNTHSAHSIVTVALEKTKHAEALAKRIWLSFVLEGRDALYLDDLLDVLGKSYEAEALESFDMLDRDGNGDVSLEEMVITVSEIAKTKQSIDKSMHDVDQAIHVLDHVLLCGVAVLVVLVFVSFLSPGFGTVLAGFATTLLSLSFVFATSCQEVLGSCIFLFVKHPYDVGDRVDISGQSLVVEQVSLLYSVFRDIADQKMLQIPNIVLNTIWIYNVTRSRNMRERLDIPIDIGTSFDDLELLKAELEAFVSLKDHRRHFEPEIDMQVLEVGLDSGRLLLRIEVTHKSNWSNEQLRAWRRNLFMTALVQAVRKIPIAGPGGSDAALGDSTRPTYTVSIAAEDAKERRERFLKEQQEGRLAHSKQAEKGEGDEGGDNDAHQDSSEAGHRAATSTGADYGPRSPASQHLPPVFDDNSSTTNEDHEISGLRRRSRRPSSLTAHPSKILTQTTSRGLRRVSTHSEAAISDAHSQSQRQGQSQSHGLSGLTTAPAEAGLAVADSRTGLRSRSMGADNTAPDVSRGAGAGPGAEAASRHGSADSGNGMESGAQVDGGRLSPVVTFATARTHRPSSSPREPEQAVTRR